MHHTLRLYARYREQVLRGYMLGARLTRIPLVGRLVRLVANTYGGRAHNAYALSLEQAHRIVEASPMTVLGPCTCRKVFRKCDAPLQTEILVGAGPEVFAKNRSGQYREVSRETAKAVLTACRERRLLHTLIRCREGFYALCSCCRCCCVPLRLNHDYHVATSLARADDVVELFVRSLSPKRE